MNTCYYCGKVMKEQELEFNDRLRGEELTFRAEGLACSCGERSLGGHQMNAYNVALADAYRKKHNLLITEQIRGFRKRMRMSQQDFADFLGTHVQSIKRWEHGCVQERSMDYLMRLKMERPPPAGEIPERIMITVEEHQEIKASVGDVAAYILRELQQCGDFVTNLRLQKLVYYVQAWCLAFYDQPLFRKEIEAWMCGPVQPEVYERYHKYENMPIPETPGEVRLTEAARKHIDAVLSVYGNYTAFTLAKMTHNEDPWRNARRDLPGDEPSHAVISRESMHDFYAEMLRKSCAVGEQRR
jgi:putative zinc finger/helix-turn-helix YgiT family protein